ncbi:MAG: hypothetical protein V4755_04330 [Curtobacterium sp.]
MTQVRCNLAATFQWTEARSLLRSPLEFIIDERSKLGIREDPNTEFLGLVSDGSVAGDNQPFWRIQELTILFLQFESRGDDEGVRITTIRVQIDQPDVALRDGAHYAR